ncbi:MAG TPA: RNA polymerase sigma factor [Ruminiclostridium sp.]|uniref:ECF RNA polymerase sigma-E factor n=1 Tax=Acetivibrio saccincola TaxID=1677857 RepID=A0A2K9ENI2_9FIRM|nr:RNA polymerase sigma factor [Acetivibrio saccincola]AUG58181.1 ECF RNA polymerase sigma-E factor [Acetivibrio saccincola]HAA42553.1 RNA polymerase sigma factor [Ruminiclostridium sp.]HOA96449.1 RNA polymerase sigma factor [Acetivibrio saccincola]HQD27683.1 RNA polymerase sigma factor [Acetivibrio saccincola]
MEASEKKIIKLCKENRREGFELLFKRFENYIYKICKSFTYSKEDALDIMQEVFLKIYKSFESFDAKKSLSPWVKRITVNTCINYKRDNNKRYGDVSINVSMDDEKNTFENVISDDINTEDMAIYTDTKKLLENLIRKLPEEVRMAIILKHIEGLSYEKIAKIMNCPEGTVKTYVFRGRKLLKEGLLKKGAWEV